MRNIITIFMLIGLVGCVTSPVEPDNTSLSQKIVQLNSYRNSASARCSGASYKFALGSSDDVKAEAAANISEALLSKGYGTGSLNIGVTLKEKTEFSSLLGRLSNEQVERFLSKYQLCMNEEMTAFYKVEGLDYPEKPKTNSIIWNSQLMKASNTVIANMTGVSGNWRSYEACVSIPENALMIKESVNTSVVSGVPAGTWGDWRKDLQFVDNNAYGPTKVCRGFDHQIHDKDRILEISVNYKLPSTN